MIGNTLYLHKGEFSILKLPPSTFFSSIVECDGGNSIICRTDILENHRDSGWSAIEIKGPLPFEQYGIIAEISNVLSKEKISILVNSSFDSDYILVKKEKLEIAIKALTKNGYLIEGAKYV